MRALAVVYERDAGPGVFELEAEAAGATIEWWLATEEDSPPDDPERYDALMVFGASTHIDQEEENPWLREHRAMLPELLAREIPLLGVCLGSQLLAAAAGSPPQRLETPEIGWSEVVLTQAGLDDPVTGGLPAKFSAFEWHSYAAALPPGSVALAENDSCLQAFRVDESAWGVQFHPEVTLEDAESWIRDIKEDSDAARIGIKPAEFAARTREAMPVWNQIGRRVCRGFLDFARERAAR